jgi:catechol 2,3-dioxygenase-like lactoylglutathione lyase family enzyme
MTQHISEIRVMVDVPDLRPVRDFYTHVLGFPERRHKDIPDWIAMIELGPGRVIEFFQEAHPRRPPAELSLQVADARVLWESIREKAKVDFPLRHNEWGDTSFGIIDPAGCRLTFFTPD